MGGQQALPYTPSSVRKTQSSAVWRRRKRRHRAGAKGTLLLTLCLQGLRSLAGCWGFWDHSPPLSGFTLLKSPKTLCCSKPGGSTPSREGAEGRVKENSQHLDTRGGCARGPSCLQHAAGRPPGGELGTHLCARYRWNDLQHEHAHPVPSV